VGKALAVSAVSIITLMYSAGSMVGPLAMSAFMSSLGTVGFFAYTVIICGILGLYGIHTIVKYQSIQREAFEATFPEASIGDHIETRHKD
jgi:hypothetical protein